MKWLLYPLLLLMRLFKLGEAGAEHARKERILNTIKEKLNATTNREATSNEATSTKADPWGEG